MRNSICYLLFPFDEFHDIILSIQFEVYVALIEILKFTLRNVAERVEWIGCDQNWSNLDASEAFTDNLKSGELF